MDSIKTVTFFGKWNNLGLNIDKIYFHTKNSTNKLRLSLNHDNMILTSTNGIKFLGIFIDNNLIWKDF